MPFDVNSGAFSITFSPFVTRENARRITHGTAGI